MVGDPVGTREREVTAAEQIFREALQQIAGATPTSHRRQIDQLTDAVKWRQGIARDALARADRLLDDEPVEQETT
jgi:hypothetical protein